MNARTGKIARLPLDLRTQLNQRLERSEPGPRLLEWLNALPETREVLEREFGGAPISKQNLSQWRQRGFQEWLAMRELAGQFEPVRKLDDRMNDGRLDVAADAVATLLAVRLGVFVRHWDGQTDEKTQAQLQILDRLSRVTVRLQRCNHRSRNESDARLRKEQEQERQEAEERKEKLTNLVLHKAMEGSLAKIFGGGEVGRKLADFLTRVRVDQSHPESALAGMKEAAAREEEALRKKEQARQYEKAARQDEEAAEEDQEATEQDESPAESDQVKAGQTSLSQSSPPQAGQSESQDGGEAMRSRGTCGRQNP